MQCSINEECLDVLADKIDSYMGAVINLIQHRDKGIVYFREAVGDINRAFKRAGAAIITGSGLGIAGGIIGIVGRGLLLGRVTAPAGIPLLAIGTAFEVSGAITRVGATIGNTVENRKVVKRANQWLHTGRDLCRDVIKKHKIYHEELEKVTQRYEKCGKDAIIGLSIERKGLDVDVRVFEDAESIITDWTKTYEVGSKGIATTVVAAGGVVIGLSAACIVVDICILLI